MNTLFENYREALVKNLLEEDKSKVKAIRESGTIQEALEIRGATPNNDDNFALMHLIQTIKQTPIVDKEALIGLLTSLVGWMSS